MRLLNYINVVCRSEALCKCAVYTAVIWFCNGKGKVLSITGHEGPEGEYRYSSTLSLTSALDGGLGGQLHAPTALPPAKTPSTHCIGGWVGPRAGLDDC
jgi:hypothetical protein